MQISPTLSTALGVFATFLGMAALTLLLLSVAPANSADLNGLAEQSIVQPAAPRQHSYAGLSVGSTFGDLSVGTDEDASVAFAGRAFVGHMVRFGRMFAGVEGGLTFDGLKATSTDNGVTVTKDQGWTADARGRLGIKMSDSADISVFAGAVTTFDYDVGMTFGSNLEVKLSDHLLARGEVAYVSFKDVADGNANYDDTKVSVGLVFRLN